MADQSLKQSKGFAFSYKGSGFFLILAFLFSLTWGLSLWLKHGAINTYKGLYYFEYKGSYFWLCFWSLIFFPIAVALLLLNKTTLVLEVPKHKAPLSPATLETDLPANLP